MALKIRVHERFSEAFSPKTVTIGNQVWTAENLAIDDGGEGIAYDGNTDGYYYTWDAAMRVTKSIPGWHLPSAQEWNDAALACGAIDTESDTNPNLKDYEYCGTLEDKLDVTFVDGYTYFWTSTEADTAFAYRRGLSTSFSMDSYDDFKGAKYFVRLVKD